MTISGDWKTVNWDLPFVSFITACWSNAFIITGEVSVCWSNSSSILPLLITKNPRVFSWRKQLFLVILPYGIISQNHKVHLNQKKILKRIFSSKVLILADHWFKLILCTHAAFTFYFCGNHLLMQPKWIITGSCCSSDFKLIFVQAVMSWFVNPVLKPSVLVKT